MAENPSPSNSPRTSASTKLSNSPTTSSSTKEKVTPEPSISPKASVSRESSPPRDSVASKTSNSSHEKSTKLSDNDKSGSSISLYSTDSSFASSVGSVVSINLRVPQKRRKHDYEPKPHVFKLPRVLNYDAKKLHAKCPSYNILVDHTLAVVWILFSRKEPSRELGIVQLQWAISFLKSIRNRRGFIPKDVIWCVTIMQERIMNLYTDVHNFTTTNSTYQDSFKKTLDKYKRTPGVIKHNVLVSTGSCYPISFSLNDMVGAKSDVIEELTKPLGQPCDESTCPMCPPCFIDFPTFTGLEIDESLSNSQMLGVLKNWRQEQVDRIEEELKKLHSIEEIMFNVNKEAPDAIDASVVEQIYAYEKKKRESEQGSSS